MVCLDWAAAPGVSHPERALEMVVGRPLVLDTNIVVAGPLWNGPPGRLLRVAIDGEVDLFSSAVLLHERAHAPGCTKFTKRIESFGTCIAEPVAQDTAPASLVASVSVLRVVAGDADDDL
jgi:hypothetical protein